MIEIWKEIKNWPGYEVSDVGRVRCWNPRNRNAKIPIEPRIVGGWVCPTNGYPFVALSKNGEAIQFPVHFLVLTNFISERPKDMEARHLDGDKLNCRLSNLKWGTPKENQADRFIHLTDNRGERHSLSKLSKGKVLEIKQMLANGVSQSKISRKFCVSRSAISEINRGKNWGWLKL